MTTTTTTVRNRTASSELMPSEIGIKNSESGERDSPTSIATDSVGRSSWNDNTDSTMQKNFASNGSQHSSLRFKSQSNSSLDQQAFSPVGSDTSTSSLHAQFARQQIQSTLSSTSSPTINRKLNKSSSLPNLSPCSSEVATETGSNASSRVEMQKLQILQNRQLQNHLKSVKESQEQEINDLKKALGFSISENKVEANFVLPECPSPDLSVTGSAYASGSGSEKSKKTPLRVRLKRRILRQNKLQQKKESNTTKDDEDNDEEEDDEFPAPMGDSPNSELSKSVPGIRSYASSLGKMPDYYKTNGQATSSRSDFMPPSRNFNMVELDTSFSFDVDSDKKSWDTEDSDISNRRDRKLFQKAYTTPLHNWDSESESMGSENNQSFDYGDDDRYKNSEGQTALSRLNRQVRIGRRGEYPMHDKRTNKVMIHVYDLIASETIVRLPWGCDFPLGQCFNAVNNGLHMMGTGAYHVGVEVNGIEYAFGANNIAGLSGVFSCVPRKSPGYDYRCTLDFGEVRTVRRSWISVPDPNAKSYGKNIPTVYREVEQFLEGHAVMQILAREYMGLDYDLLRKNCCTFARDCCIRLGVKKEQIPTWFLSLAEAGVATEDAMTSMDTNVVTPLKRILSGGVGEDQQKSKENDTAQHCGFEIIAEKEIVRIVESVPEQRQRPPNVNRISDDEDDEEEPFGNAIGIRHTLSWTY